MLLGFYTLKIKNKIKKASIVKISYLTWIDHSFNFVKFWKEFLTHKLRKMVKMKKKNDERVLKKNNERVLEKNVEKWKMVPSKKKGTIRKVLFLKLYSAILSIFLF